MATGTLLQLKDKLSKWLTIPIKFCLIQDGVNIFASLSSTYSKWKGVNSEVNYNILTFILYLHYINDFYKIWVSPIKIIGFQQNIIIFCMIKA